MARRNSSHFETFPYNQDYYTLLRFKENERFSHYAFQARSPQVSMQALSRKVNFNYLSCFVFHFAVTSSARVDKSIERAQ